MPPLLKPPLYRCLGAGDRASNSPSRKGSYLSKMQSKLNSQEKDSGGNPYSTLSPQNEFEPDINQHEEEKSLKITKQYDIMNAIKICHSDNDEQDSSNLN